MTSLEKVGMVLWIIVSFFGGIVLGYSLATREPPKKAEQTSNANNYKVDRFLDKDYNIACYRAAEENSNNGSTIVFSCVRLGD